MKMKQTRAVIAITSVLASYATQAATTHTMTNGGFTFYNPLGVEEPDFGHNDVQATFDLVNGTGAFTTSTFFNGISWVADVNAIEFYNPTNPNHTYSWSTQTWFIGGSAVTCNIAGAIDNCTDESLSTGLFLGSVTSSYNYSLTNTGQFAVHMFFDWSTNFDIPVLDVFQVVSGNLNTSSATIVSVDSDNDGAPGHAMLSNPYPGQTMALSGTMVSVQSPAVPVPATAWLFGSGLLGLIGLTRRKKSSSGE